MADRPNFYELLGLDPEKDADWKVIEERIEAKRRDWARDVQGSPKKRQEAKRNLDLLPDMRKILSDPVSRRQEAEEARRLRREARENRENELAGWIELLRASGRCRPEQFEKLRQQFADAFPEQEIRRRLVAAGIRVIERKPPRPRIDPSVAEDLRRKLDMLKLANLYEFLGLPATSSAEDLRARAEEIYKQNLNLGRTDATISAQNSLVGPAKIVFKDEEEKRKYDNELLLASFETLDGQISVAGSDGVLSAQAFATLVRLAVQRGVPEEDAVDLLEERAAREGWRVEASASGPAPAPAPSPAGSPGPSAGAAPDEAEDAEPPAPSRLIVQAIPGGLRLLWEPVGLEGIRYRVLRKANSVPRDEGDGELITQAAETRADDAAVPPQVPWHYAVFSLRNGLASRLPAHSGPHLLVASGAAGGAPVGSRRLGRLPLRGIAAGLTVLALGGGAAFFWGGLPPLLGGARAGTSSSKSAVSPKPVGQQPPSSTTAPGAGNAAQANPPGTPSGAPSTSSQNASPTTASAANSAAPLTPSLPSTNQQVSSPGGIAGGSGSNSGSAAVLGTSATRISPVPPPPPPPSVIPRTPEVAVIAVGDPLLASPLEDELASALRSEGIDVMSGSPTLEDLRRHRSSGPSVSDILASLHGDGVHAVVIAQVDRLADRELQYYGRKDVVSTSRVRIHAYLVDGRRALGSGWSDQIEYNAVNAATEGENAAHRAAPELADAVRNGWSSLLGSNP